MGDITAEQYIILEWFFLAVCLFFFIARLAVRTWKRMWKFWQSEVWLGISITSFAALVIGCTYTYARNLDDFGSIDNPGYNKWKFAVVVISEVEFYFPRFCLLAFYHELFPISEEKLRKCLKLVIIYNACACVADFLMTLFWCGLPMSKNWSTVDTCKLFLVLDIFKVTWPMNLLAEILVFILPFGMLHRLKATPRSEKIAMACLFGIGIITIALSIARFVFTVGSVFTYSTTIVSSAEVASQIVVCAVPALRPLLPPILNSWSKLISIFLPKTGRSEDERTLQGSYSAGAEKDVGQANDGNLAELGEWHSEDGSLPEISHYGSRTG